MTIINSEIPTGFAVPAGDKQGPNCGVTAVSIVCGIPFDQAWTELGVNKGPQWKGWTTVMDWIRVFNSYSIKYTLLKHRRPTLQAFVRQSASTGVRYMVRTTGHVQLVENGWVIDQAGPAHISKYWGRRKRITHVIELHK